MIDTANHIKGWNLMQTNKKSKSITVALVTVGILAVIIALLILVINPGVRYGKAEALLESGEYIQAAEAFDALENFKDAPEMANLSRYREAERLEAEGRNAAAAMAFGALGDYSDARARSFALWDEIAVRETFDVSDNLIGLREDGSVVAIEERFGKEDGFFTVEGTGDWRDVVEVSAGGWNMVVLKSDGTVLDYDHYKDEHWQPLWTDVVDIDMSGFWTEWCIVGLKSDGTVVHNMHVDADSKYGQGNVEGWRNIISVRCSEYFTLGLRANGTVIASGLTTCYEGIEEWTDIVAIAAGSFHAVGLKSDGTVVVAGADGDPEGKVSSWRDVIDISASLKSTVGLRSDGTILYAGDPSVDDEQVYLDWTNVTGIDAESFGVFALKPDGTISVPNMAENRDWGKMLLQWRNIRQSERYAYYQLDDQIVVDAEAEQGEAEMPFTNKYGTRNTICAHAGCNNQIASSGDTNCCTTHSNRCGNCGCYIDGDAMYCMTCLKYALD